VLVTLYGGNDGLNTIIPSADPRYLALRPTLGYHPDQVIPLAEGMALHANLKGLKTLWDTKQLAIVRGVGYPDPVLSHFRSMDIWQTASPARPITTGWLGRWLDTGTDPMRALSVGPALPLLLRGEKETGTAIATTGVTIPGGPRMVPVIAALDAPGPDRAGLAAKVATSGANLLLVQHTLAGLLGGGPGGGGTGGAAGGSGGTGGTGGAGGGTGGAGAGGGQAGGALAAQLDLVARLIKAGSPTRVYQVSLGGFDSHAQEKQMHANLMAELDGAITGFLAALKDDPLGAGVVLLTYSEFSRRPAENASLGTDHGTAAPLLVAGPGVKGGQFYGEEPSLTALDQGNLKYTTDFRSVYATLLERVLGVDPKVALESNYPTLKFV
jgi:uncharacterized protein (DUF1501 family)